MDTRLQKLILSLLLLVSGFTVSLAVKAGDCITDGLTVCFNAHQNAYQIETHAHLKILVPNDEYGKAVVAYWDWYHPEFAERVTYELTNSAAGSQDVLFISQAQAGQLHEKLFPLDHNLIKNVDLDKVTALNYDYLNFIPVSAEGFAFLINKTRLELLGLSTQDNNKDGLIDSVDTFEKIIALQPLWDSLKVNIFPFALNEPYSFYPFLTAGGFRIFSALDALKPGFESEEFKQGLQLVEDLSQINWNHSESNLSQSYTWMLDEVVVQDNFVFTIAGPWMNIGASAAAVKSEWIVSKFPTYQKNELAPMVKTSGFAINKETYYPSAAHELIRILKSIKGTQLLIDHTSLIPLVNAEILPYLVFDEPHRAQLALAYETSVGEPVIAFLANPKLLAIELFYNMDVMSSIRNLWDKSITIEEAQNQIIAEANRVITTLNLPEVP